MPEYITILKKRPFDGNEPLALDKAQAVYLHRKGKEPTLTLACPKCGQEVSLSDHQIFWHTETLISVEPSILHEFIVADSGFFGPKELLDGSLRKNMEEQKPKPCGAHFRIIKNEIQWC